MLPPLVRLHIIVNFVPLLVDEELAGVVHEAHTLYVASLVILADVNVADSFRVAESMLDVVLLACITSTNVGA